MPSLSQLLLLAIPHMFLGTSMMFNQLQTMKLQGFLLCRMFLGFLLGSGGGTSNGQVVAPPSQSPPSLQGFLPWGSAWGGNGDFGRKIWPGEAAMFEHFIVSRSWGLSRCNNVLSRLEIWMNKSTIILFLIIYFPFLVAGLK